MHGLHGDSVPEAAIMLVLALVRDLPARDAQPERPQMEAILRRS